jgi:hypothetical protein
MFEAVDKLTSVLPQNGQGNKLIIFLFRAEQYNAAFTGAHATARSMLIFVIPFVNYNKNWNTV